MKRIQKKIKSYGRKVKNFNDEVWNQHKIKIMKKAVYEKFKQNNDLKNSLLLTGNKTLAEASPFDKIWGIGLNEENARKTNPANWKGTNLLGKILMEVRAELS